jgi:hypothetical protein
MLKHSVWDKIQMWNLNTPKTTLAVSGVSKKHIVAADSFLAGKLRCRDLVDFLL